MKFRIALVDVPEGLPPQLKAILEHGDPVAIEFDVDSEQKAIAMFRHLNLTRGTWSLQALATENAQEWQVVEPAEPA